MQYVLLKRQQNFIRLYGVTFQKPVLFRYVDKYSSLAFFTAYFPYFETIKGLRGHPAVCVSMYLALTVVSKKSKRLVPPRTSCFFLLLPILQSFVSFFQYLSPYFFRFSSFVSFLLSNILIAILKKQSDVLLSISESVHAAHSDHACAVVMKCM
jgi:hypothetical protein